MNNNPPNAISAMSVEPVRLLRTSLYETFLMMCRSTSDTHRHYQNLPHLRTPHSQNDTTDRNNPEMCATWTETGTGKN